MRIEACGSQHKDMTMDIRIKRVYQPATPADGLRVLVDRLWPRGLSRERAQVDLWAKAVAPSTELRRWFGHEPGRFAEFARRYEAELRACPDYAELLAALGGHDVVTLLFGARDEVHNQAVVLADRLRHDLATGGGVNLLTI